MTTVITLSAGSIVGVIKAENLSNALAIWMFIPIGSALVQQLFAFMGQLRTAQSAAEQLTVYVELEMGLREQQGVAAGLETAQSKKRLADWWYGWADQLCFITVGLFICIGLGCLFSIS